MKTIFVITVMVAVLASSCSMPQLEASNSLRSRVLGTPQAAQVQASLAPTSEPTTPPQQAATAQPSERAQLAGAVANVVIADPSSADPFEVARAALMAIGGVIGFFLFAIGIHALITRRAAWANSPSHY